MLHTFLFQLLSLQFIFFSLPLIHFSQHHVFPVNLLTIPSFKALMSKVPSNSNWNNIQFAVYLCTYYLANLTSEFGNWHCHDDISNRRWDDYCKPWKDDDAFNHLTPLNLVAWTSLVAQIVKHLSAMLETRVHPWVGKIP